MRKYLSAWAPVAVWCALIFVLSGIPDLASGLDTLSDLVLRKCAHFVEYAVLAALLWRALETSAPSLGRPAVFWMAWGFAALYAASDEWHQSFVPGRGPSVLDVALDSAGALAACALQWRWKRNALSVIAGRWRGRAARARSRFVGRGGAACLALLFLAGCGRPEYFLAQHFEKAGRHEKALKLYLRAGEKSAGGRLAPKALFAGGRLAGVVLKDYSLARGTFQRIISEYGDRDEWGRRAERALFDTPNYFPLVINGHWEEGDSETGGSNATIRITCRLVEGDPAAVLSVHSYYAGETFLKQLSQNRIYRKTDLELQEQEKPQLPPTVILKYPFERGASWTSRRAGRTVTFRIEDVRTVRVRAGEFKDCLVVREHPEGISTSWQLNYYAPGVGRVLTSLATASGEKRNTELMSYDLAGGYEAGEER